MAKKSIGEANIKLTVDGADKVKKDLRDVKTETEDATRSLNETVEAADRGINAFRKWASVFGFVTVAIGGAIGALKQLVGGLGNVQEAANKAANEIRRATDPAQFENSAEKLREFTEQNANFVQRAALISQGAIDGSGSFVDSVAQNVGNLVGLFSDFGKDQAELYTQLQRDLTDLADQRRKELETAKQIKREEELTAELTRARISRLEGVERVEAEFLEKRKQLNKQIEDAQINFRLEEVELLKQIADEEAKIAGDKIRAIKEQKAAEEEARRNAVAQDQQRQEDAAAREVAQALRETQRALAEQAKAINDNTRELAAMRSRIINFTPDIRRGSQALTRRTR